MPMTPRPQDRDRVSAFKARWRTSSPTDLSQKTETASPSLSHHRATDRRVKKDPNAEFRKALKLDVEETDNEIVRGVKDEAAAAAIQFRNTLHSDLDKTWTQNRESFQTLQNVSSQKLEKVNLLYTNITAPLAETVCHSDSIQQGVLGDHLLDLEAKIKNHEENIARHEEKLREAVQEEQALWDKLEGLSGDGEREAVDEGALREYEEEVKEIVEKANRKIAKIEQECRVAMNKESLKMMELIMAD